MLDVEEFLAAAERVARGGSALDPQVVAPAGHGRRPAPLAELSDREREVLELMAEGLTNAGIAERLVAQRAHGRGPRPPRPHQARHARDRGRPSPRPGRARPPAGDAVQWQRVARCERQRRCGRPRRDLASAHVIARSLGPRAQAPRRPRLDPRHGGRDRVHGAGLDRAEERSVGAPQGGLRDRRRHRQALCDVARRQLAAAAGRRAAARPDGPLPRRPRRPGTGRRAACGARCPAPASPRTRPRATQPSPPPTGGPCSRSSTRAPLPRAQFGENPAAARAAARALRGAEVGGEPVHLTGFDALAAAGGGSTVPGSCWRA